MDAHSGLALITRPIFMTYKWTMNIVRVADLIRLTKHAWKFGRITVSNSLMCGINGCIQCQKFVARCNKSYKNDY